MTFGKIGARKMMWNINNLLPKGGRWVEYLESTGTQYVDTGFVPNLDSKAEISFAYTVQTSIAAAAAIFGERGNTATDMAFCIASSSGTLSNSLLEVQFDGGKDIVVSNFADLSRHTWVFSKAGGYYDGVFSVEVGQSDFIGYGTCWIFGRNSPTPNINPCKIYIVKIWDNSTLVRDFRPIAIGNTGYMLDLLTGEYEQYGNKGTGEFVIGPTIAYPERERVSNFLA